ncbi:MAG: type II secretion system protein [Bacilli bacterium]|nr:type II secretion system protein [Bacilli bacterium]
MNKKGFTLVEIILVIAIMALLVIILVPNIFIMIDKNNEKSFNNLKNNIESAAKIYVTNNKYNLNITCYDQNKPDKTTTEIKFQTLIDSGELKTDSTGKITNPINDSEILLSNVVKVIYNCDTRLFSYEVTGIDCTNN